MFMPLSANHIDTVPCVSRYSQSTSTSPSTTPIASAAGRSFHPKIIVANTTTAWVTP